MTNQHPLTPPPELVEQWAKEKTLLFSHPALHVYMTTRAAQWGADQELEACCLELVDGIGRIHAEFPSCLAEDIRASRRPKPPSLKEQALESLERMQDQYPHLGNAKTIRRALEALDD
jgi:hypothetical protein